MTDFFTIALVDEGSLSVGCEETRSLDVFSLSSELPDPTVSAHYTLLQLPYLFLWVFNDLFMLLAVRYSHRNFLSFLKMVLFYLGLDRELIFYGAIKLHRDI